MLKKRRFLSVVSVVLLLIFAFSGCQSSIGLAYSDLTSRYAASVNLSRIAYDYAVEAVFDDKTKVEITGTAKLRLNSEFEIVEASDDVSYAIPEKDGSIRSKMDLNIYWTDNTMYMACVDSLYRAGASVQNSVTVLPTVLFDIPEEAVTQGKVSVGKNAPCTVSLDANQMQNLYALFGNTFETLTSSAAAYRYDSFELTLYSKSGYVNEMNITATLLNLDKTENEKLEVSAEITFNEPYALFKIDAPTDFDAYSTNRNFYPFA